MGFSFLPSRIVNQLTDLTPQRLQDWGISLLLLDFDNTVVPYTTDVPTAQTEQWFSEMKQAGIALCMVSNSKKPRVWDFCRAHDIPCIQHARKPFWRCGIAAALQKMHAAPGTAAMVGDQIFTDTLGGNAAGIRTILVSPICLHNIWLKLRHGLEKPFIFLARGRSIS